MEDRIQHYGREILGRARKRIDLRFRKRWLSLSEHLIRITSRSPYTKVKVLRFVNTLPNLQNRPEKVTDELYETFPRKDRRIALPLRLPLALLQSFPNPCWLKVKVGQIAIWVTKRVMARRFFIGQTTTEAIDVIRKLRDQGQKTTIDALGEAALSEAATEEYVAEYEKLFAAMDEDSHIDKNVSIKITALYSETNPWAYAHSKEKIKARLVQFLKKAKAHSVAVTLDMEQYEFKDLTLDIFLEMYKEYPELTHNFSIAIQSYLKESPQDLKRILSLGHKIAQRAPVNRWCLPGVRLVKGAYWDTDTARFKTRGWSVPLAGEKAETDILFEENVALLLEHIEYVRPAFGTHNVRSMAVVLAQAKAQRIHASQFEFQVLYGMIPTEIVYALKEMGHAVRYYAPYGKLLPGLAYLVRRVLENSSQASFLNQFSYHKEVTKRLMRDPRSLLGKVSGNARKENPALKAKTTERLRPFKEVFAAIQDMEPKAFFETTALIFSQYATQLEALHRHAAHAVLNLPGERNQYRYVPRGHGLIALETEELNISKFAEILAAPLVAGNSATVLLPERESWSQYIKQFSEFFKHLDVEGEVFMEQVPREKLTERIHRVAVEKRFVWVVHFGGDERSKDLAKKVYDIKPEKDTHIKSYISEMTPDYLLHFLHSQAISENILDDGFALDMNLYGGLGAFRNESPTRPFDCESQSQLQAEIQALPKPVTAEGSSTDLEEAVKQAKDGFAAWAQKATKERADILRRAAYLLKENKMQLAALVLQESHKPQLDALGDVDEAIDFLNYYAALAEQLHKDQGFWTERELWKGYQLKPKGVVAVIAPWNFPLAILTGMTAGALAAGNTVIMKPAEQSPRVAQKLYDYLIDAGVPKEALHYLPGTGEEVGRALVRHPDIDVIAFTGSREVGFEIIRTAARIHDGAYPKTVVAEMGGKNAIIVDEDADLDHAALGVIRSAFGYSGQKCSACSRVIVVDGIRAEFLKKLKRKFSAMILGEPKRPEIFMGPLIDPAANEKVEGFKQQAKEEGLKVLIEHSQNSAGLTPPIIYDQVAPESKLAQDEIFGPILVVLDAEDFDQALEIANETRFGLTAGLYSKTPSHIAQFKEGMEAGNLYINRPITGAVVGRQPFGGFKQSGTGHKAGGPEYLWQFMRWVR